MTVPPPDTAADRPPFLFGQLMRFAVVGGLASVVDAGLYATLIVAGSSLALAKALSFIAGTTVAYIINRRWTFQAATSRRRFVAVVALYAITFAIQVGINSAMVAVLPHQQWWRLPAAFVIAQGAATSINFVAQRTLIFKKPVTN